MFQKINEIIQSKNLTMLFQMIYKGWMRAATGLAHAINHRTNLAVIMSHKL